MFPINMYGGDKVSKIRITYLLLLVVGGAIASMLKFAHVTDPEIVRLMH